MRGRIPMTTGNVRGTVLVLGATGNQGGAVARELLHRGWPVRALTRDPRSAKSQALAAAGAQLVAGDLEDPQSLDAALSGAYGIYSVQTFMGPDGIAGEERQGRAIAEAAARVKVEHFVYGSVGGAERNTSIPHFESKHRIGHPHPLPRTGTRPAAAVQHRDGRHVRVARPGGLP